MRRRGAWISRKGGMRKKHIMQIWAGSLAFQNSGKEITKSGEKHIFGRRQICSHSLDRKLFSLSLSLYRTLARSSPPLSHAFALNASLLSYFLVCDFYFFAHSASDLMCVVDISSWSIHSGFRVGFLLAPVNSLNFCLQGFNMVLENNPPC